MNTQTTERRCVHSDTAQPDNYDSSSSSPPSTADATRTGNGVATLVKRAATLREGRKYEPAIGIYRAILKRVRKHPALVAGLQSELARCYTFLGQYDKATYALRRAANIAKKVLGRRHPDRALYVHNLAAVYEAKGKCVVAERHLKLVRAILRRTVDHDGLTGLMPWNAARSYVDALANLDETSELNQLAENHSGRG